MRKNIAIVIVFCTINLITKAQPPNFEWAKQVTSTLGAFPYSITTDASGNIYAVGFFKGTTDFDPNPNVVYNFTTQGGNDDDIFISKLDPLGNLIWAKHISGINGTHASSIILDNFGNIYITGDFYGTTDFDPGINVAYLTVGSSGYGDAFVLKLDNSGNFVWVKKVGGLSYDYANSIKVDVSGNLYIAGTFTGTVDFDPGSAVFNVTSNGARDVFVLKLDTSGNFIWAKQLGGLLNDNCSGLSIDSYANIYISGYFIGTSDFDPGSMTSYTLSTLGNKDNTFICKLNGMGQFVWAKQIVSTAQNENYSYLNSIVTDNNGNVFVTGFFTGTTDFDPSLVTYNLTSKGKEDVFIIKLNSGGNLLWAKQFGGIDSEGANALNVDISGNVYTTGTFKGSTDFNLNSANSKTLISLGGTDIFISKLDSLGNLSWVIQLGGNNNDKSLAIHTDVFANLYTTGYFSGAVDFDHSLASVYNLISLGSYDMFIHKMSFQQSASMINVIEDKKQYIHLYPNPNTGQFTISSNELNENTIVIIYNSLGQEVYQEKITQQQQQITTNLTPGVYFLKLQGDKQLKTQPLIIN